MSKKFITWKTKYMWRINKNKLQQGVYMFINILIRNFKLKTYLFSKIQLVFKNQILKLSLNTLIVRTANQYKNDFAYILTKYIIMTAIKKYIPNIIYFKLQDMKVMDIELIV